MSSVAVAVVTPVPATYQKLPRLHVPKIKQIRLSCTTLALHSSSNQRPQEGERVQETAICMHEEKQGVGGDADAESAQGLGVEHRPTSAGGGNIDDDDDMPPLVPQLIVSPSRRHRSGHDQVHEQMRYTLANTAPDSNEHRIYDTPYSRLERPMPPSARLARPTTQTLSPLSMHEEEEKQDVDSGAGAGAEGVQGLGDELQHTPNAAAGEGDTADDDMPPLVDAPPPLTMSSSRGQENEQMQYTFATTMTPVQFGGVEPEADNIEEARDSEHELYGAPYNTYEHPMPPGVMLAKSFSQTRSSFNTSMLPTRNLTYPPLLPPNFPPPSPTGSTATSRTSHSHSRSFSFTVGGSRFLPPLDYDEHDHDDEPPEASLVECDPDVDIPSIESQVGPAPRTSSKRTAAHERERAAGYIPRPPNAFILFRASFVRAKRLEMSGVSQAGSALNPDTSKTTVVSAGPNPTSSHATLSKLAGQLWRSLDPGERAIWEARAAQAQAEHRRKYPDWRFRPANASGLRIRDGGGGGGTNKGGGTTPGGKGGKKNAKLKKEAKPMSGGSEKGQKEKDKSNTEKPSKQEDPVTPAAAAASASTTARGRQRANTTPTLRLGQAIAANPNPNPLGLPAWATIGMDVDSSAYDTKVKGKEKDRTSTKSDESVETARPQIVDAEGDKEADIDVDEASESLSTRASPSASGGAPSPSPIATVSPTAPAQFSRYIERQEYVGEREGASHDRPQQQRSTLGLIPLTAIAARRASSAPASLSPPSAASALPILNLSPYPHNGAGPTSAAPYQHFYPYLHASASGNPATAQAMVESSIQPLSRPSAPNVPPLPAEFFQAGVRGRMGRRDGGGREVRGSEREHESPSQRQQQGSPLAQSQPQPQPHTQSQSDTQAQSPLLSSPSSTARPSVGMNIPFQYTRHNHNTGMPHYASTTSSFAHSPYGEFVVDTTTSPFYSSPLTSETPVGVEYDYETSVSSLELPSLAVTGAATTSNSAQQQQQPTPHLSSYSSLQGWAGSSSNTQSGHEPLPTPTSHFSEGTNVDPGDTSPVLSLPRIYTSGSPVYDPLLQYPHQHRHQPQPQQTYVSVSTSAGPFRSTVQSLSFRHRRFAPYDVYMHGHGRGGEVRDVGGYTNNAQGYLHLHPGTAISATTGSPTSPVSSVTTASSSASPPGDYAIPVDGGGGSEYGGSYPLNAQRVHVQAHAPTANPLVSPIPTGQQHLEQPRQQLYYTHHLQDTDSHPAVVIYPQTVGYARAYDTEEKVQQEQEQQEPDSVPDAQALGVSEMRENLRMDANDASLSIFSSPRTATFEYNDMDMDMGGEYGRRSGTMQDSYVFESYPAAEMDASPGPC